MILLPTTQHKTYAVFGLARSGLATARALEQSGARALVWDDSDAGCKAAEADGFVLSNLYLHDFCGVDALVISPGVPLTHPAPHPLVLMARAANVPVMGDIELFAQSRSLLPPHKVVGITGTNGKSTTTALIHHVLVAAGRSAQLGGNIGLPILSQAAVATGGIYVLELSSFQIDLTQTLDCDVAVLTNITPDHLDRHGDMAGYARAKERLFDMQSREHIAVVGQDDDYCVAIGMHAAGRLRAISGQTSLLAGVSVTDGNLRVNAHVRASQADWPALQGSHNGQNAAAAYAACMALGLSHDEIVAGFASFAGLPHRMERIATKRGVLYVNDSKATNAESAAPALGAYPHIHWIVGGKRKADDLDACLPYLNHVRAAYVIGESKDLFYGLLSPHVKVKNSVTLEHAVQDAAAAAEPGDVVLLSPACASQDQFKDYEQRGDVFRAAVLALGDEEQ
jgi:UDP-N-acetylmuramoylalanine--D-glutamate ligase